MDSRVVASSSLRNVEPRRKTIATFSIWTAFPGLLILLCSGFLLLYFWYVFAEDPADFVHNGVYRTYAIIVASLFYFPIIPLLWKGVRQMLFDDRRAVWVEAGELIYLDRSYFNIRCSDISSVARDHDVKGRTVIAFLLKNGNKKLLPLGGLSTSTDLIEGRLKEALNSANSAVAMHS